MLPFCWKQWTRMLYVLLSFLFCIVVAEGSHIYARAGDDVILQCPVNGTQWFIYDNRTILNSGTRINPILINAARLSIINNTVSNRLDLRIQSVTSVDEAVYTCIQKIAQNKTNIEKNITFSLYVKPSKPSVNNGVGNGTRIEGTEGQSLNITCTASGGNPFASVTWMRGQLNVTTQRDSVTYQFVPTRTDDLQIFTCVSDSPALDAPQKISVQLYLKLKPLKADVTAGAVSEKNNLAAQCISSGSRPPAKLYWTFRGVAQSPTGQLVVINDTATETFNVSSQYTVQARRSDNRQPLVCTANSTAFTDQVSGQRSAIVWFGPDSLSLQGTTYLTENTFLRLICRASLSNPRASLQWTKNGSPLQVTSSVSTVNGQYGGVTTQQEYSVTVRREDNRANITCTGSTTAGSAANNVILNVTYRPTVVVQPPTQTVIVGDLNINIVCNVQTANPAVQSYTWSRGSQTRQTYVVANVSRGDAGVYNCTATNQVGTSDPASGNVNVLFPPVIEDIQQQNIEEGSTLTVTCNITSNPPPSQVYWTRSNDARYRFNGNPLMISNIQRGNSDVYTCHAENVMTLTSDRTVQGRSQKSVTVNVLYGPGGSVQIQPASVSVEENINKDLPLITCSADCNPVCSYSWSPAASTTKQLTLGRALREKNGTYTCTAKNRVISQERMESSRIDILLFYAAKIQRLDVLGGDLHNEHSNVSINCTVNSYPISDITWRNTVGRPVHNDKADPSSVLRLADVACSDTGSYTCSAYNGYGVKNESTVEIIINCYPRLLNPSESTVNIGISDNEDLNISAVFLAFPKPDIIWYFRRNSSESETKLARQPQVVESAINIFTSTLLKTPEDEGDFGEYIAIASNIVGPETSQQVFKVDAKQKPKPAVNLSVNCLSHDTANISWIPGFNGGLPQTFHVFYKKSSEGQFTESREKVMDQQQSIQTSFLKASTLYIFKVRSVNELGHTDSESEVYCTTKEKGDDDGSNSAVIGAASGVSAAAVVIIVVVVVIFYLRLQRKTPGNKKETNKRSSTIPLEGEDGLRDNVLYVSADSSLSKAPDVYAEVQKTSKKVDSERQRNDVYAEVQKPTGKKKGKGGKGKGKEKIERPGQEVYENVEGLPKGTQSPVDVHSTDSKTKERGYRNQDGLLYVEVDLKPVAEGRRNVIIGEEDRTDYASVDFVAPQPSQH